MPVPVLNIILIFMVIFLWLLSLGFLRKKEKIGGSRKWIYNNKNYKKSNLPIVDYDLPSLYEKMKMNDPWSLWPQVLV